MMRVARQKNFVYSTQIHSVSISKVKLKFAPICQAFSMVSLAVMATPVTPMHVLLVLLGQNLIVSHVPLGLYALLLGSEMIRQNARWDFIVPKAL